MAEMLTFSLLQGQQRMLVFDCLQVASGVIELQLQKLPMPDEKATLEAYYGEQSIIIDGVISSSAVDQQGFYARLAFDAEHDMALRTFVQLFYMNKYAQETGHKLDDLEAVAQDWVVSRAAKFSAAFDKAIAQQKL